MNVFYLSDARKYESGAQDFRNITCCFPMRIRLPVSFHSNPALNEPYFSLGMD